jgi:hypothetical protein
LLARAEKLEADEKEARLEELQAERIALVLDAVDEVKKKYIYTYIYIYQWVHF